jgi:hypothetical protein
MVGYAGGLATTPMCPGSGSSIAGKISRGRGARRRVQRQLLEAEGVHFDPKTDSVDFSKVGWPGPDWEWLEQNGFNPAPLF